jgi:hypothetical protein
MCSARIGPEFDNDSPVLLLEEFLGSRADLTAGSLEDPVQQRPDCGFGSGRKPLLPIAAAQRSGDELEHAATR